MNEPKGNRKNKLDNEVENALKSIRFKDDIWEFTIKLFKQIHVKLKRSYNFTERYLEFMNWINLHIEEIGDFKNIYDENYFVIPTFEGIMDNKMNIGIQEFFYQYNKTAGIAGYLNFSWGLSTGESTLISLFSRLFSITKKLPEGYYLIGDGSSRYLNEYYKKAIILIDEADLTLHPEWQQKYVKSIVNFIQDIYQECQIQIVITTHSPIILSDIPKNNVIFLKAKDNQINVDDNLKHSETFGANITTLFYDSFFMDKGSIGEFAKNKINNIIQTLKPNAEGETPVLNISEEIRLREEIHIIGDEVLKNKLHEMLKKCTNQNNSSKIIEIEAQIRNLEIEKEKLKGEKR